MIILMYGDGNEVFQNYIRVFLGCQFHTMHCRRESIGETPLYVKAKSASTIHGIKIFILHKDVTAFWLLVE